MLTIQNFRLSELQIRAHSLFFSFEIIIVDDFNVHYDLSSSSLYTAGDFHSISLSKITLKLYNLPLSKVYLFSSLLLPNETFFLYKSEDLETS